MKSLIIIHHSAINDNKDQFSRINTFHGRKGFPISELGFNVGYHFLIERTGMVKRARNNQEMGAHTLVKGYNYNKDGIGICLAGDFTKMEPSEEQIAALNLLCEELTQSENIPINSIIEHRDVKATSCPGYDFAGPVRIYLRSKTLKPPQTRYSPQAQLKRLTRAINRSAGYVKSMLERQLERLLKRIGRNDPR